MSVVTVAKVGVGGKRQRPVSIPILTEHSLPVYFPDSDSDQEVSALVENLLVLAVLPIR